MTALRKSRLQELSEAECWTLLRQHEYGVGRVAVGGAKPIILPVNYLVDGDVVVMQTGEGEIMTAAMDGAWFAFEIDSVNQTVVAEKDVAWSVLAKGPSRVIMDRDQLTFLRLGHLEPQAGGFKPNFVGLAVKEISGRRRH